MISVFGKKLRQFFFPNPTAYNATTVIGRFHSDAKHLKTLSDFKKKIDGKKSGWKVISNKKEHPSLQVFRLCKMPQFYETDNLTCWFYVAITEHYEFLKGDDKEYATEWKKENMVNIEEMKNWCDNYISESGMLDLKCPFSHAVMNSVDWNEVYENAKEFFENEDEEEQTYNPKTTIVSGIKCNYCKGELPPMTMADHLDGKFNLTCPHK